MESVTPSTEQGAVRLAPERQMIISQKGNISSPLVINGAIRAAHNDKTITDNSCVMKSVKK
jgi:hypothetical protein